MSILLQLFALTITISGYLFDLKPHVFEADGKMQMPGYLSVDDEYDPVTVGNPTNLVHFLTVNAPMFIMNAGLRVSFIVYAWLLIFILFFFLTAFMTVMPFIGVLAIWTCFGTVITVNATYLSIIMFSISITYLMAVLNNFFLPGAQGVFGLLYQVPQLTNGLNATFRSMYTEGAVNARNWYGTGMRPVLFDGIPINFEELIIMFDNGDNEQKANAWALATYMLYAPSRSTKWTNYFFCFWLLMMFAYHRVYFAFKTFFKNSWFAFKVAVSVTWIGVVVTPSTLLTLWEVLVFVSSCVFYPFYWGIRRRNFSAMIASVRLCTIIFTLRVLALLLHLKLIAKRNASSTKGFSPRVENFRSFWNNTIIDLGRLVDNIAIPHFIRTIPDRFDADAINETFSILRNLGFPNAPTVGPQANEAPLNFPNYREAFIGGTSIRQGIRQLNLQVAKELSNLKGLAPEYKRSEQFASLENELESVARYFEAADVELPDVGVDEIWVLIGDIFRDSMLTPFAHIIKKWEKKYGLGPMWGDLDAFRWKKLSRKKFITSIGGIRNLVKLWAKTFEFAPGLVPVAGISVKGEALPPKKWQNDVVRTVVSSPLSHYIMSTIWNFQPNHNFKFWTTNIKVGMPLNGINLGKLWSEHDAYNIHFAGDFTAFDSTVNGKVVDVIKNVRKKGFERHRDYAKICFLIDANYAGLKSMPLMTTSTGNIYKKEGGLSTGHSSTSMDNSLAATIYYLCVWKSLTGLSAHEFRYYCKLSNYGDDHILSWLQTAPSVWNKSNIMHKMTSFGVGLRDEEPSGDLFKMSFLSKFARKPNTEDIKMFEKLRMPIPKVVVFHDRNKLIGKCYAPSKDYHFNRDYRIKRLVSYLDLTAHQEDVYQKIHADVLSLLTVDGIRKRSPVPIPTYEDVVAKWYNPLSHVVEESPEVDPEAMIMDYSAQGYLEHFVNALSVLPDLINPAIYNMGYTNYFMSLCGPRLHWPIELLRRSNDCLTDVHLVAVARKTPYDFLVSDPRITSSHTDHTNGGLLLKHWAFCALRGPIWKPRIADTVQYIDKKLADLNFLINGHVQTTIRRLDLPILQILLVASLDFIPDIPLLEGFMLVKIPSFSSLVEAMYGMVVNTFWSRVPPNMKQVASSLDNMGPEAPCVLVEAPTGTGKSTTLVSFVHKFYTYGYNRLIIVEPRAALPLALVPYLRSAFSIDAFVVGENNKFHDSMRVIVTTPQEVLLHEDWLNATNLFFIDECHVHEPAMNAVMKITKHLRLNRIMATATPSEKNLADADVHVPMTIANVWSINEINMQTHVLPAGTTYSDYYSHYQNVVVGICRSQPLCKYLIFVIDLAHAESMALALPGRSCILSSQSKEIDKRAQYFVATSVADVGITIPNVDWVLTSNLQRSMGLNGTTTTTSITRISPALVKQRKGRTGRTNNGMFTLIRYEGDIDWITQDAPLNSVKEAISLITGGAPMEIIAKYYPDMVCHFFGRVYTQESDQLIDDFVSNFKKFETVLDRHGQRSFKSTADGRKLPDYWTIAGNTLPSSSKDAVPAGGDDLPAALSAPDMIKFMLGAAKYITDRHTEVSEQKITGFLRAHYINAQNFVSYLRRDTSALDQDLEDGVYGDPSGRFGRKTKPGTREDEGRSLLPTDVAIENMHSAPGFKGREMWNINLD